ncbi:MAG: hypothetical protein GEU90_17160 [Gemmatimonas sp.]|nr:hypothetical protein [Gemmatimonas sp.]
MHIRIASRLLLTLVVAAIGGMSPAPVLAQEGGVAEEGGRPLSLEEALTIAAGESEQVAIAEAEVVQAESEVERARAARLPDLTGSASYSRALVSQFDDLTTAPADVLGPPQCETPFEPSPSAATEQRIDAIEFRLTCPPSFGFGAIDFEEIGFGAENTYSFGLSFSLPVFTGGRLTSQSRIAAAGAESAQIGLESSEAQLRLDVTRAYSDAQLADRLVQIAQSTYDQLAGILELAEVGAQTGTQAEFELLRARVALQNQEPIVIQREAQRDIAYDRLRQLLNLAMDTRLDLTSSLEDVTPTEVTPADDAVRAPVRQAAEAVRIQESQVNVARSQRLPNVSLSSDYWQVAYSGLSPSWDQFRDNWNVGASLQIPIFTGGRITADVRAARAALDGARAEHSQTDELAQLDTRIALAELAAAGASWEASQGTVEQAEEAYAIAELRYREGISSQLELTDSRVLLEEALGNRATAARDLRVAEARVALLPYLPLSAASATTPAGASTTSGMGGPGAAVIQPQTQPSGATATPPATPLPGGTATPPSTPRPGGAF